MSRHEKNRSFAINSVEHTDEFDQLYCSENYAWETAQRWADYRGEPVALTEYPARIDLIFVPNGWGPSSLI